MNRSTYPSTFPELKDLADAIVAAGFPGTTQRQSKNNKRKIEQISRDMLHGRFDWSKVSRPIIVDCDGVVLDGNHRVIASALSGLPIPTDKISRLSQATPLDVYEWIDTLPPP